MVPIAYASSEGSDEPAHPWKIASALTAHIHNEGMWGGGGGGGCHPGLTLGPDQTQTKGHGNGSRTCLRSKKPTIRPRVVVVLRLGKHAVALAQENGLSTQNIIASLAVSPFHGFA